MNIGVFGGTFDPIHFGHLALAEEVMDQLDLDLDEILFMPAGQPWFKLESPVTSVEHRVAMVHLAIAGQPGFRLSTLEIERGGTTYTVDTMAELRAQRGEDTGLYFILGQDSLADLPRWRDPGRLISLCRLVVLPRPGTAPPDLANLEAAVPGLTQRVVLMDRPEVDISASAVRERVMSGQPIYCLVPAAVEEYIRKHRLYLES